MDALMIDQFALSLYNDEITSKTGLIARLCSGTQANSRADPALKRGSDTFFEMIMSYGHFNSADTYYTDVRLMYFSDVSRPCILFTPPSISRFAREKRNVRRSSEKY